jgi:hypothetical protein
MTPEFLEEVQHKAGLLFPLPKLSIILEIPEPELRVAMDDPSNPLGQAIHKGRLLREAEIREAVIRLALQGSGPAQAEALRLIKSMD